MLAPQPSLELVTHVLPDIGHHCTAVAVVKISRPAFELAIQFGNYLIDRPPERSTIEFLPDSVSEFLQAFGMRFDMRVMSPASSLPPV